MICSEKVGKRGGREGTEKAKRRGGGKVAVRGKRPTEKSSLFTRKSDRRFACGRKETEDRGKIEGGKKTNGTSSRFFRKKYFTGKSLWCIIEKKKRACGAAVVSFHPYSDTVFQCCDGSEGNGRERLSFSLPPLCPDADFPPVIGKNESAEMRNAFFCIYGGSAYDSSLSCEKKNNARTSRRVRSSTACPCRHNKEGGNRL